jgi:uncharacterized membrane protein YfcA
MNALLPTALTLLVLFLSSLTRSTLGFGDALIAMPLLVMLLGVPTTAPLVALVGTAVGLVILVRNWYSVDMRAAWPLILASACGIPLGLVFLHGVSEVHVKALLGVLLVVFASYNLLMPPLTLTKAPKGLAYTFGFFAGILGGAYNTVGPLLVMYGNLHRWPPDRFRATLQGCFFPAYGFIVIGHGLSGALTSRVLVLFGLSLPVLFLATLLGEHLNAALHRERFTRYINGILLGLGLLLCLQALRS